MLVIGPHIKSLIVAQNIILWEALSHLQYMLMAYHIYSFVVIM